MLSDCQRANSAKGIFVLANAANSAEHARLSAEAHDISNIPGHGARVGGGLNRADRSRTRRASLDPGQRDVFNRWARVVLAFYSLIVSALVGAALLAVHGGGGQPAPTSAVERGTQAGSASVPRSAGK